MKLFMTVEIEQKDLDPCDVSELDDSEKCDGWLNLIKDEAIEFMKQGIPTSLRITNMERLKYKT